MKKIYVGNLNYRTTEETLKEAFLAVGDVTSVNIIEGRGFGFVEMKSDDEAALAIEKLNGSVIDERPIRVNWARPMKKREYRPY